MAATVTEPHAAGRAGADVQPPDAASVGQAGEQRSARLESLRALGALGVIVSHTLILSLAYTGFADTYKNRLILNSGHLGLYLFFALSGYLLFLPFARHQFQGRAIDVYHYARNRALRILPLYYGAIALLLVFHPFDVDRSQWWRFALLIQNYSAETINRLNAPLWTISVEIQYYILLPLLAWVLAQLSGPSMRRTVAIMLGIALASFALRAHEVLWSGNPDIIGAFGGKYALLPQLYAFIAGMLIAVARLAWERRPPAWAERPLVGAASVWIAGGVVLFLLVSYDLDWQEPTLALAAFLIVGACVLPLRGGWLVRALEWRPLATLGIATFSLYVWHGPIVVALSGVGSEFSTGTLPEGSRDFKTLLAIGVPLCIAAGALSYLLLERPFLRRRQRWGATAAAQQPTAQAQREQ